jgi:hypothetical protein
MKAYAFLSQARTVPALRKCFAARYGAKVSKYLQRIDREILQTQQQCSHKRNGKSLEKRGQDECELLQALTDLINCCARATLLPEIEDCK